ncbi:hypothetical protein D3C87_1867510 [compost metagenome]
MPEPLGLTAIGDSGNPVAGPEGQLPSISQQEQWLIGLGRASGRVDEPGHAARIEVGKEGLEALIVIGRLAQPREQRVEGADTTEQAACGLTIGIALHGDARRQLRVG